MFMLVAHQCVPESTETVDDLRTPSGPRSPTIPGMLMPITLKNRYKAITSIYLAEYITFSGEFTIAKQEREGEVHSKRGAQLE
jgi:hypothetical protein